MERGAPGVVLKPRGLDAYFPADCDHVSLRREIEVFAASLCRLSARRSKAQLRWATVHQESWEHAWKRFIKPRRVGKSFWVTPPWIAAPKFRRRRVITIEPGMAFGTGAHATTRSCLEFLEEIAGRLPAGFTALDVGTGSGILAIALAQLGAGKVLAIDHDPIAVRIARENVRANLAGRGVRVSGAKIHSVKQIFDVVAANLTTETILGLAGELERKVRPRGFLVLSGVLGRRAAPLRLRFAGRFQVVKQARSREWLSLLLQRK